ncbi:hypothetical protein CV093_10255 [Oceanobacillus sp. 143]|uniref:Uncharacterized protein n=1 Tax=Oceanobacillus zhaokaii TaxID=2052660 RepID=A0A345PGQ5_9BACI|nr:hypothetical protein [Oceanobacillus zhaokaii]AXI09185.1 hypothetical protein CUC15_09705 [Oceanobacillus zhaokaii]QGS68720.1 hypothetical protein CV093_10255 [Oceanobacillus sp. 143]
MKWQMPPSTEDYKLVASWKEKGSTYLTVFKEDGTLNINWSYVESLGDENLKSYLLSMREEIESGIYHIELTNIELNNL